MDSACSDEWPAHLDRAAPLMDNSNSSDYDHGPVDARDAVAPRAATHCSCHSCLFPPELQVASPCSLRADPQWSARSRPFPSSLPFEALAKQSRRKQAPRGQPGNVEVFLPEAARPLCGRESVGSICSDSMDSAIDQTSSNDYLSPTNGKHFSRSSRVSVSRRVLRSPQSIILFTLFSSHFNKQLKDEEALCALDAKRALRRPEYLSEAEGPQVARSACLVGKSGKSCAPCVHLLCSRPSSA